MVSKPTLALRLFGWLFVSLVLSQILEWLFFSSSVSSYVFSLPVFLIMVGVIFAALAKVDHDRNYSFNMKPIGIIFGALVFVIILSILLNFLGPICCGPSSNDVLADNLKRIYSKGFGVSVAEKVVFEKGIVLTKKSIIADLPLDPSDVSFFCNDCPGLSLLPDRIEAVEKSNYFAVVCGDDSKTEGPRYCVAFGKTAGEANETCTNACGIA